MKSVTGVFQSRADAERVLGQMRSLGIPQDHVTLLTPDKLDNNLASVPVVSAEQPGIGGAVGAVIGAAAGISGGWLVAAAVIPGVGAITALGLLGGAILAAAGGSVGAIAGEKVENSLSNGLPEDELFVYEDALRKGRSVVIALVEDGAEATRLRELLNVEGAESVDAARDQWWIGLRSAEHEHYTAKGKNFDSDEKFYRLGFEAALHARTRCMEYDQVLGEMTATLEAVKEQNPGADVEEPFTKGYERGRDYYQRLCDQSKAA
jgi:hypothetical protein